MSSSVVPFGTKQLMFDRQQNLRLHAEIILDQQFVGLRDGAGQRIIDGQHPVRGPAALDRRENVRE